MGAGDSGFESRHSDMKKRAFIIHGWEGTPNNAWFPWLKNNLKERGFEVIVPEMPNTEEPKVEEWISHLKSVVGNPDENTYFVGHSIGCQAIMKYLETLPQGVKIGGAVFVAGWFSLQNLEDEESEEIAKSWLETPVDLEKILNRSNNFITLLSENDGWVSIEENKEKFERLGKVILAGKKGHFTEEDGVTELPEALNSLLEIAN